MESLPRPQISKSPEQRDKYVVRVEKVSHEVLQVNPEFAEFTKLPPETLADFAYFAVDASAPETETTAYADVRPGHNRSLLWGQFGIKSNDGTLFRDFNIKGAGYTKLDKFRLFHPRKEVLDARPIEPRANYKDGPAEGYSGLMSLEDALIDFNAGEQLADLGIRTSRGIAIIKLNEIYYPGEGFVAVEELKSRTPPAIDPDFIPVVYVRAMGTDARGNDYSDPQLLIKRADPAWLREKNRAVVLDAIEMVEEEIGKTEESLTLKKYISWFAATLGENIARLHANGLCHASLANNERDDFMPQNVTLDCRITDLDSVKSLASNPKERLRQMERDKEKARHIVMSVLWMCEKAGPTKRGTLKRDQVFVQEVRTLFSSSYEQGLKAPTVH